jgi:heptosyltransferase-1
LQNHRFDWGPRVPDSSLRILIVKLSAIGDVIHGLPVLNALRSHFPRSHISWVVEGRAGDLLRGHPALDRLIVIPRRWLASPKQIWSVWRTIHQHPPDVAVDLQCLARSAVMALLSGAPRRIGFAGTDGREFSRWLHTHLIQPKSEHVIDRNLELLRPLGIVQPRVRFDLPRFAGESQTVAQFMQKGGMPGNFAVINPGAGWASKRWEMDRFAQVADYLGKHHGLPSVVVWAGAQEKAWAEQIVGQVNRFAFLAPPTTLRELAELIRRATLFVGSDTGPLHLAAAVGTNCVGLFGPVSARRNGPYGNTHIAVQRMHLSGPSRMRRSAANDAMQAITAVDVYEACDQILQRDKVRQNCA